MRRRRLWRILPAILIVAAAISLYWWLSVERLADGFASWAAAQRQAGWTVAIGTPSRGGWPWAAILTIPDVSLHGDEQDIPGGVSWGADRLVLRVVLWRPTTLQATPEGGQHMRLANGPDVPFTAKRMRLDVRLASAPPYDFDFTSSALRAGDMVVGSLRLHGALRPDAQSGEPALAFTVNAGDISPPAQVSHALGPRIASISADGSLDGPVPHSQSLSQRASDWRDGGGTLALQDVALSWGPLELTGSATLSLDDTLQPMGTGAVKATGYAETLDALAVHGVLTRPAATAAKAVLSLLAQVPDDNGPPSVEVPLTLQYRTLSMRQVPLVRLPEVDWP